MWTRIVTFFRVLANREWREILEELKRRFWSTEVSFCLRRDLGVPFDPPRARAPFEIRPVSESDDSCIIGERPRRLPVLRRNLPTCYVATSESGEICYMQWLIGPASNDAIREVFAGCVPPLASNEALMEYAYTFLDWRGKNIMPRAMALIAEKAQELGCRYVMTFVREENLPALKGCERAGFHPYRKQSVKWRLFRRVSIDTVDLPRATPHPSEGESQPIPQTAGAGS